MKLSKRAITYIAIVVSLAISVPCVIVAFGISKNIATSLDEIAQQKKLIGIQQVQEANISKNKILIASYPKLKITENENIVSAIVNISKQMENNRLTGASTKLKLEKTESVKDKEKLTITEVSAQANGTYGDIMPFLNELVNGEYYYFLNKISIAEAAQGLDVSVTCSILGADTEQQKPQNANEEIKQKNPFGN